MGFIIEYSPYITKYLVDIQKYEDEIKELEQEEPYYFKITINDKQGKEIIKSFHKMSRSTFENEVHTIEIQASSKYQNSDFRINIDFSDKKDKSYTSIKTTGDSAKVTATGITQELKKRTLEYTNHHNLFYGSHNYILYILALVGANAYVILDEIYIRTYYYIYIAFLGILLIYIILRSISPYCTIPTQKNENRNKFKKWLFGIGISFLLSIGLFYFKSNVLGQEVKNERDKDSNLTTR